MPNDFNELCAAYQKSETKPDKLYSILPTILKLAGYLSGKTVLDLGSGSGFFTEVLAKTADNVIGLDNSSEQIALAEKSAPENVEYRPQDIFSENFPISDLVNAPFVLNYSKNIEGLAQLIRNIFGALTIDGKAIFVIDMPSGEDLTRFGAKKSLESEVDGSNLKIELFKDGRFLCELNVLYYSKETITKTLSEVGFRNIEWHKPIISEEGIKKFGPEFWEGYIDNPELGYVTAVKL